MTHNYTITIQTPANDPFAYTAKVTSEEYGPLATFTGPGLTVRDKVAELIFQSYGRALLTGAELVEMYTRGDGREYLMTRRGRDYTMTGGTGGPHTLTDASEERAMAHWKGYRGA